MQTTLRIDTEVYRQAKARAAREGITLTRFINEALALRLGLVAQDRKATLPSFRSGSSVPSDFDLIEAMKQAEETNDIEQAGRLNRRSS